ncbi:hypothetical protein ACPZ19_51495 [Amycolatopsis lurida]
MNSGVSASPRIGSVTNPGDTPFVLLAVHQENVDPKIAELRRAAGEEDHER